MKAPPKISAIMPAYNAEIFLSRAIESVLGQTFKDYELIILDDGSQDNTLSIARKYERLDSRIRVVSNPKNMQIAATLNKGIRLSKAEFIARMDTDDISYPNRFELQYKVLINNPSVAIVGANMKIINISGETISQRKYPTTSQDMKKIMFRYSPFAHPAVMFRKQVVLEFGGYDLSTVPCEDIDLWFKIGSRYEFSNVNKFLLKYTIHRSSNSHRKLRQLELLGLKIKINAIKKFKYQPSLYDVFYNIGEYSTLWLMPASLRIWLYNFLRNRGLI